MVGPLNAFKGMGNRSQISHRFTIVFREAPTPGKGFGAVPAAICKELILREGPERVVLTFLILKTYFRGKSKATVSYNELQNEIREQLPNSRKRAAQILGTLRKRGLILTSE